MKKLLPVILLTLLLTGCSSFERDWRHARLLPPAPRGSLAGPWQGTWLSDANGHNGKLRCLVTETRPGECQFRFKATYAKIFRYSYIVTMPVEQTATNTTFKGEENLGYLAGGVYHYQGNASGTNLTATYRCKFDHGTFSLSRP